VTPLPLALPIPTDGSLGDPDGAGLLLEYVTSYQQPPYLAAGIGLEMAVL
jgi:hypothetical protein